MNAPTVTTLSADLPPMATPKGPRSWGAVLELLGANGEAKRRAFGVRWDRLDRDARSLVLRCWHVECRNLAGHVWADLTLIEQRHLVKAAQRMARVASEFLG